MQTTLQGPAESAGAMMSGLAIQQRERETTLQRLARLRKEASAEIERLIAFLDASDPYASAELELAIDDEACDEDELDGDESDDEPNLGSLEISSQAHWAAGSADDLEDDSDSGIGDMDGLLEQVGTQDWEQGAMA